jgi:hypothetical protein
MKRVMQGIRTLRPVTWLQLIAVMGTAIFVAVMCLMDQISRVS